ncbi:SRPBCC family protein [Microbacterium sp. E-13]|uniref:SRPBCC family protein n=1 Tax=Microbacterium sp. E-13 TaxID=3404048 RepID=UPI003CEEA9D9
MTDIPEAIVTDRDVYITRTFHAPRDIVWMFWTDPDRLAEWFGPTGFHSPASGITSELVPGGVWRIEMHADGSDEVFPMSAHIRLVIPPEYLEMIVGTRSTSGQHEEVVLRVRLHDHGEVTRMTLHQGPLEDPDFRRLTREGWLESFTKLELALPHN